MGTNKKGQASVAMHAATEKHHAREFIPRRRVEVRIQVVGNETLVLDHQSGNIHQLNVTASNVWQQCDGKTPLIEIVDRLIQQFEVSNDVAVRDVAEVIEKLQELNLLCD